MKRSLLKVIVLFSIVSTSIGGILVYSKIKNNINEKQQIINNLTDVINVKENELVLFHERVEGLNKDITVLNQEKTQLQNEKTQLQNEKMQLEQEKNKIEEEKDVIYKRREYLEKRTDELEKEIKKKKVIKEQNGKVIAVDIGHNINVDTGSVSKWVSEDKLTDEVGIELIKMLENEGYKVLNVTPNNKNIKNVNESLKERITKANGVNNEVNLFVSIHFNSAQNKNAQGTEVFYYEENEKSKKIGNKILENFGEYGFKNRGLKKSNFYVLKNAKMPALLIECGFIMNVNDMTKYDPYKMAENIFNAIKAEI